MLLLVLAVACCTSCTGSATAPRLSADVQPASSAARKPPYRLRALVRVPRPTHVATPRTTTGKLFIVQKTGLIRVFSRGRLQKAPFLDLRSKVGAGGSEQGLLSVAFHPDFRRNGLLYVYYTERSWAVVVAEYRSDGVRALPGSERILVRVRHEDSSFHNGGQLLFGPDGRLYAGIGDGGYTRDDRGQLLPDPHGNAQNLDVLLGKIFALDVSAANPRPEIVAYGLRNPWRFSVDPGRNAFVIGDVGWNTSEEVDYLRLGSARPANFGWSVYEGRTARPGAGPLNQTGELTWPAHTYSHVGGNCSLTGGFVYRGSIRSLRGRYLFGDYCSGRIWSVRLTDGRATALRREPLTVRGLSSFGEDARGELYAVSVDRNRVYKLVRA